MRLKTKKKQINEGIAEAISKAGDQSALANLLGCTQGTISLWLSGNGFVPTWRVLQIEQLFKIKRKKLRPDLWGAT